MHESDNLHLLTKFSWDVITDKSVLSKGNKLLKKRFDDKR